MKKQRLQSTSLPSEARLRQSLNVPRTVQIGERKTGLNVENAFWAALKEIAAAQEISVARLVASGSNLTLGALV
jgi:predicted DNA-binding ribbon-helix-helix protein